MRQKCISDGVNGYIYFRKWRSGCEGDSGEGGPDVGVVPIEFRGNNEICPFKHSPFGGMRGCTLEKVDV